MCNADARLRGAPVLLRDPVVDRGGKGTERANDPAGDRRKDGPGEVHRST